MSARLVFALLFLAFYIALPASSFASAYNGHPKLVVVIVIDQFRGDYLDRYRDQFGDAGFRLFLDHGAYFPNCNYNYANTRTAPGHATLFTGAYSNGHGIADNEWWDPKKKKMVTSVEDADTKLVGIAAQQPGASPHNLLADTLGDELKLATQGKSRVFGISLKDRAAVLPAGFVRRCCLLDRSEKRRLDYLHLLSQRPSAVGAEFQFQPSGKILGPRVERLAGSGSAFHGASQEAKMVQTPGSMK